MNSLTVSPNTPQMLWICETSATLLPWASRLSVARDMPAALAASPCVRPEAASSARI